MADLRAYQPSFTAGVLSPALWARVDLAKYASGLKQGVNLFVHPHGGASNRAGLEFIREVKNSANFARLIPFEFNTEQTYQLEFGDKYMRVFKDGGLVLTGGGAPYELVTPYAHAHVGELVFVQEADVMYIVHPLYEIRKIGRLADNNWTISVVNFAPSINPPASALAYADPSTAGEPGYTPRAYYYAVSAVSEATGEESVPYVYAYVANDLTIAGGRNRIQWTAVPGASRYIVYKEDNGVYGYIGGTAGLQFFDENIVADVADTPQNARNPFVGAGNYPRCVTFIEQRLAFASTLNDPQAVWMSQSASYENFGYSNPAKASDAVTFRIKARQVNEIRSMLAVRGLMLLTSGAEWIVSGGSNSDAITPSAIKIDNQGYRGSARVQPVLVGNMVLFAQARGGVIRDFGYEFANDSYTGKDLTIMARHFFENKNIVAWAYAQAPYSMAWVILDDGSLVSLTYMKEHDVWAWTNHISAADAVFEDVSVVAEGNEDVPYFIVRRKIGGVWKRYIERLHSRAFSTIEDAFFVDSGLTYNGPAKKIITGLDHLNGMDVVALADGNVVRDLTVGPVTGGIGVTLPYAASKAHIGLPMEATLQTLDADLGNVPGLGTVQGRQKSVSNVTMRVENTRGIWVGGPKGLTDKSQLIEFKQRESEAWNEAIRMLTGDLDITPQWDWDRGGNVVVKQFDPLPMTILAIMPELTVGK